MSQVKKYRLSRASWILLQPAHSPVCMRVTTLIVPTAAQEPLAGSVRAPQSSWRLLLLIRRLASPPRGFDQNRIQRKSYTTQRPSTVEHQQVAPAHVQYSLARKRRPMTVVRISCFRRCCNPERCNCSGESIIGALKTHYTAGISHLCVGASNSIRFDAMLLDIGWRSCHAANEKHLSGCWAVGTARRSQACRIAGAA